MAIKAVLGLSGGLDSAVLLASLIQDAGYKPDEILAFNFCYGSKHGHREASAATQVMNHYGILPVNRRTPYLEMSNILGGQSSALLGSSRAAIPEGHYNDENMRQTVVPGRNLIFISVMAAAAEAAVSAECKDMKVFVGAHQGDHFIYPDCRPTFLTAASEAVLFSSAGTVTVHAPFMLWDKVRIVAEGLRLNVPFGLTRTCYTSDPVACGRCGSCRERLEAFEKNGREDFIEYQGAK